MFYHFHHAKCFEVTLFSEMEIPEKPAGDHGHGDERSPKVLSAASPPSEESQSPSIASLGCGTAHAPDSGAANSEWSSDEDEETEGQCQSRYTPTEGPWGGRLGSEPYWTASDDSSSVFEEETVGPPRPGHRKLFSWQQEAQWRAQNSTMGRGPAAAARKERGSSSEELDKRFHSHRLDFSSSSSEANTPSPILTPALNTRHPARAPGKGATAVPCSNLPPPKLRPPTLASLSVALARRHLSQPQLSSDRVFGTNRNAISMVRPPRPQETDLDLLDGPATDVSDSRDSSCDQTSFCGSRESPGSEEQETWDVGPPPTPPLHRFPSWVSAHMLAVIHMAQRHTHGQTCI